MEITKQTLNDRMTNTVYVGVSLDGDWSEGDYSIHIEQFIGSLAIDVPGGCDDPYLIKECIAENADAIFNDKSWPYDEPRTEGFFQVTLVEGGEWQGYEWVKWYDVKKVIAHDLM